MSNSYGIERGKILRANIITDDNVTVAYTQKVYKLTYLGTPYKKERLHTLLNKISKQISINKESALKRYFRDSSQTYKVLLYGLTREQVGKIQKVLDNTSNKGFSFVLSGERRVYPYGDFLTPVLGYNKKLLDKATNFTYLDGVSGLEKEYDMILSENPLIQAEDIHLSIDFIKQKSLEKEVDGLKALYNAQEVISVILDTENFHIKAFASSNRYNPTDIHRENMNDLSIHGIQYLFQLESFATLVKDTLYLNTKNPKYEIYADLELDRPSGIDLPYERVYSNKDLYGFQNYKVNFMQLVKAYSLYFSGGYIANPKIVKFQDSDRRAIISKELAQKLKTQAEQFFGDMPGKRVTLEFEDKNVSANIYMTSYEKGNKQYIKAYFTIYHSDETGI
ncbi:hypothetical protein MNY27_10500 [Sulfurimonas sp. NWX79]